MSSTSTWWAEISETQCDLARLHNLYQTYTICMRLTQFVWSCVSVADFVSSDSLWFHTSVLMLQDMHNRRICLDLLLELSERQHLRQFVFITPLTTRWRSNECLSLFMCFYIFVLHMEAQVCHFFRLQYKSGYILIHYTTNTNVCSLNNIYIKTEKKSNNYDYISL